MFELLQIESKSRWATEVGNMDERTLDVLLDNFLLFELCFIIKAFIASKIVKQKCNRETSEYQMCFTSGPNRL